MKLPRRLRYKLTARILTRYDGEPYTKIVHRDREGNPITTVDIHTGDYTCFDGVYSPKFLLENPDNWEEMPG